jgi:hypothetical protein
MLSLQVGKVVQGGSRPNSLMYSLSSIMVLTDPFKLSDETDLDIINHTMDAMVDLFQNELRPVASQLTARRASALSSSYYYDMLTVCSASRTYASQERVWHSRTKRSRTTSIWNFS